MPSKMTKDEMKAFSQQRLVKIQVKNNVFSSVLLDRSGKIFKAQSYTLSAQSNPIYTERDDDWRVGCVNNAYIVRAASWGGCQPGCGKYRTWDERTIRKLPNGSLQVTGKSFEQRWGAPLKVSTDKTAIFSAYHGMIGNAPADQFKFEIDREVKGKE